MNEKTNKPPMPLYQQLAINLRWYKNTKKNNNTMWQHVAESNIDDIIDMLPGGSGIDSGVKIDLEKSTEDKIILYTEFHHMNEVGMYDGWTDHKIVITGSMAYGFKMTIYGQNKNEIKDYLYEIFDYSLREVVPVIENKPEKNVYHN
jgi:hypothetical protein